MSPGALHLLLATGLSRFQAFPILQNPEPMKGTFLRTPWQNYLLTCSNDVLLNLGYLRMRRLASHGDLREKEETERKLEKGLWENSMACAHFNLWCLSLVLITAPWFHCGSVSDTIIPFHLNWSTVPESAWLTRGSFFPNSKLIFLGDAFLCNWGERKRQEGCLELKSDISWWEGGRGFLLGHI